MCECSILIAFGHIYMSVCLSVMLWLLKAVTESSFSSAQVRLQNVQVSCVYQGHRVKVKVIEAKFVSTSCSGCKFWMPWTGMFIFRHLWNIWVIGLKLWWQEPENSLCPVRGWLKLGLVLYFYCLILAATTRQWIHTYCYCFFFERQCLKMLTITMVIFYSFTFCVILD